MQRQLMRVVRIDPSERFALLGANVGPNLAYGYRCPDGSPGVSFSRDQLDRVLWTKERSWGKALNDDERRAFTPVVEQILGGGPPVVGELVARDFRCPRCNRPVVVVFHGLPDRFERPRFRLRSRRCARAGAFVSELSKTPGQPLGVPSAQSDPATTDDAHAAERPTSTVT